MKIEISKATSKGQPKESKYYPVLSYKSIAHPLGLLLVSEGTMSNEDGSESDFLEIKKIQFIASCKTEFSEEPLLTAFYLGEGGDLYPHILSTLSGNYYQEGERFILIDYKSYTEICEYTGETKLPIAEYIKEIRSGTLGANALLNVEGEFLNYTEQNEHYKELDKVKLA